MLNRYKVYAITHIDNRVKIDIHNWDTDEDINLDLTQEDMKKLFIVMSVYMQTGDLHWDEYNCKFEQTTKGE